MKRIYLDNQATTPVDPRVYDAMVPWFTEKYGNAASRNHPYGWEADEAVEIAREQISELIGAIPKEIIFTSGATEANNLALQGAARNYRDKGGHIITLKTEHKAVLDVCDYLEKDGFEITCLPVGKDGILDLARLENALRPDTILISVMHANNEIGVIQPIKEIGAICKKQGIIFHVDAAQSVGKIPVDIQARGIDLLSISAHKIYGPKGVGALYIRRRDPRVQLQPIIFGGGHERGIRSGTLPVPNIVGLGKACALAQNEMGEESIKVRELQRIILAAILAELPETKINGHIKNRLPGNLNLSFPGINNEALIAAMPEIAISSGAACTTSTMEPSHVLMALGLSKNEAYSSIRIGIGRFNSEEDIETAGRSIISAIKKLQKPVFAG